jgi:hypothetical protein
MPSDVGLIAQAVTEIAKIVGEWRASSDRRRMQACIEAAEKYIRISECEGEYENLPTTKRVKYLQHYRKRFFAYNQ